MKRLIFCFDGTWNALGANNPTNVVFTAASIMRETPDKVTQIIHYDEGVGTGRLEKMTGGMSARDLPTTFGKHIVFLFSTMIQGTIYLYLVSLAVRSAPGPSSALFAMWVRY